MNATEILPSIFSDQFWRIFPIIFVLTYIIFVAYFLTRINERIKRQKKIFFETFLNGIIEGTIIDSNDLLNIFSGLTNYKVEDLATKSTINKWLRELLAKLINKELNIEISNENRIKIKEKLTSFIIQNEKVNPNSDLPEAERNIINDINSYLLVDDKNSVSRKVSELISIIITRSEQHKKIEIVNKWSIPLAIVGLVLTIIFGVLSLI